MSEAIAINPEQDDGTCLVPKSFDNSRDSLKQTESNDDQDSSTLEQRTNDKAALECLASVDATVDNEDFQSDSSNSIVCESSEKQGTEEDKNKENGVTDVEDEEKSESDGEYEHEEDDEQTATCSLLGLEQAKVQCNSFIPSNNSHSTHLNFIYPFVCDRTFLLGQK